MKTTRLILLTLLTFAAVITSMHAATVTGRSAKTTPAGTEKVPIDDSGTDKYITIANLFVGSPAITTPTITTPVIATGLTASGSGSNNFSGSTGAFQTSSGLNTFNGSGHAFASILYPTVNDGAALGSTTYSFSDLFLASGTNINIANSNWVATHTSGILTVGTGDLRITTAGTNTASVVTVGGTQTLASKTLTAPVIAGATSSGSTAIDFSGNSGAFKSSTGVNTFGGSNHIFAAKLEPASDDGAALGSTSKNFSDLFLASGAVVNFANSNVVVTHSSGILTMGTGELRITTAGTNAASVPTLGSTSTLTNKTLTAPVINGATSASGDFDLSGSSGTFKSSTGVNTFGGSNHIFAAKLEPASDDGAALGSTSKNFSDLFLASGAVVNFANSNVVVTHSSGILTMGTGDFRVSTAGTNAASVVTVGGTQTLTNKTLTSPTMTTPTLGAAIATSIESLTSGLIFEGSTADANETTVTVTDPTADRTITLPDASGTIRVAQASTAVSLTADNQAVTPGSANVIQLSSDNATATNRTFTLSATGAITGAIYILIGPASNGCEIAATGIQKLSATWSPGAADSLTLLFDGTNFIELARSNN
jgi:hypothetical protein